MSTCWTSALAVVLGVAGCNAALGIGDVAVDTDGDGIPDDEDNCPTVYNPDQLDSNPDDEGGDACAICATPIGRDLDHDGYDDGCDRCIGPGPIGVDADGDGIDDGCDPCVNGVSIVDNDTNGDGIKDGCEVCVGPVSGIDTDHDGLDDACDRCNNGPPHDEDGDGIEDGCDVCPALADVKQTDSDGDGVGDACDIDKTPQVRKMFDSFLVDHPTLWQSQPGWSFAGDAMTGTSTSRVAVATMTNNFDVVTRTRFEPGTGGSSVVELRSTGSVSVIRQCVIARDGTVTFVGTPGPVKLDTSGPIAVTVSVRLSGGTFLFTCTTKDRLGTVVSPPAFVDMFSHTWQVALYALQTTVSFDFIDIVGDP